MGNTIAFSLVYCVIKPLYVIREAFFVSLYYRILLVFKAKI
jgi:hypothetical protein